MGQENTLDQSLLLEQSQWVRSLARSLVRDPSGADDVAQETLLAALSSPPRDAADSRHMRAWLGRVAFNLAHLSTRRNMRRRAREENVARSERETSTADAVIRRSVLRGVGEAVSELTEPYRTAVQLRYFEGKSTTDIARETGTSESAVRKRLWRARGQLRQVLDARHNGERAAWFQALAPLALLPDEGTGPLGIGTPAGTVSTGATLTLAKAAAVALVGLGAAWSLLVSPGDDPAAAPQEGGSAIAALAAPGDAQDARVDAPRGPSTRTEGPGAPGNPGVRGVGLGNRVPRPPVRRPNDVPQPDPATTVAGHVIDLWGNPIGGADIVAAAARDVVLTRTAANGAFTVGVRELPVTLEVERPGTTTLRNARLEALPGSRVEFLDPWIVVAPAIELAGGVVDAGGRPLAEASVAVVYRDEVFVELPVPAATRNVEAPAVLTDAAGEFRFDAVATGPGIELAVTLDGYRPITRPMPEYALSDLVLMLEPELPVAANPVHGVVVDGDGRPVPGSLVSLAGLRTWSDDAGAFTLDTPRGLFPVDLVARKRGFGVASLRLDESSDAVELTLGGSLALIQGDVTDTGGRPLPGWLVFARPESADEALEAFSAASDDLPPYLGTATDPEGHFELLVAAGEEYALFGLDPVTGRATRVVPIRPGSGRVQLRSTAERAPVALHLRAADGGALAPGLLLSASLDLVADTGTWSGRLSADRVDETGYALIANTDLPLVVETEHPLLGTVGRFVLDGGAKARGSLVLRSFAALQVAAPEELGGVAAFSLQDGAGNGLELNGPSGPAALGRLSGGVSPFLTVDAAARTIVWLGADGEELGRRPIELEPGQGNTLRP